MISCELNNYKIKKIVMKTSMYPCLWYNNNALEAAEYYCRIFPHSQIKSQNNLVVIFELNGQKFMGLNGGPVFTFTEAISYVIECDTQEEIDYYWESLTADGGQESNCGWLKDRYGMSWQVVPRVLSELMSDPERAPRVVESFMKMKKLDIETLMNA